MKIGVIIQARTSSTRLPQKVLKELPVGSGVTVLQQIIRRLKRSKNINEVIVATTEEESDTDIANVAKKENVTCYRGSLNDVLGRYYSAAKESELDVVVRVTGDCPCIDPTIVDLVIEEHLERGNDFTSNVVARSYPDGLDVEVLSFNALEDVFKNADQQDEREHVTAYIYKHQNQFKMTNVEADVELFAPERRITLDTQQDYELICSVYDELYASDECFDARSIMKLFKEKPSLDLINT